jgi:alpha-1,4-digalacturonate transport system permease protein
LQLALRTLSGAESVDWATLLASSVLTMIPVVIVFIIFNKQIMSTNVASGVKG